MSDWEAAERRARIDHIKRLLMRGASPEAVLDSMAEATVKDVDAARKRIFRDVRRGGQAV